MSGDLLINDELLAEAQRVGGHHTKQAAINEALKEYVERRRQSEILVLFGQIEYLPDYDYRKQRDRS